MVWQSRGPFVTLSNIFTVESPKIGIWGGGGGVSLLYFAFLFLFKLNLLEIFNV